MTKKLVFGGNSVSKTSDVNISSVKTCLNTKWPSCEYLIQTQAMSKVFRYYYYHYCIILHSCIILINFKVLEVPGKWMCITCYRRFRHWHPSATFLQKYPAKFSFKPSMWDRVYNRIPYWRTLSHNYRYELKHGKNKFRIDKLTSECYNCVRTPW